MGSALSRGFKLTQGLPQGASPSCILFGFYISDLSLNAVPRTVRDIYVDDILVSVSAEEDSSMSSLQALNAMQMELARINRWCKRW